MIHLSAKVDVKGIVFDARHIENIYSGLGRYTFSLLDGLIKIYKNKIIILLNCNIDTTNNFLIKIQELEKNNSHISLKYINVPLYGVSHHFKLPFLISKYKGYLYFYPHFDFPLLRFGKSISVIHDMLPFKVSNYITKNVFFKKIFFYFIIKFSTIKRNIIHCTVSRSTSQDIKQYFSPKLNILVAHPSCFNLDKPQCVIVPKYKYLFYIGDWRTHKNIKFMIDIFLDLKIKGYEGKFVIAGSTFVFDFDVAAYTKNCEDIIILGNLNDLELYSYYKNMDALFFLSQYEGFGLPVIEVAKLGKKVICFDFSSLPEVAPPWALMLHRNVSTVEAVSEIYSYLIKHVDVEPFLSDYSRNFSWKKTAAKIFL